MTTRNLNQDAQDDALRAAAAAAADVRRRRDAARAEALRLDGLRRSAGEDFVLAARATDQRFADQQAELGEELGQLDAIFSAQNPPVPTPPAADPGPLTYGQPAPDAPAQPEPPVGAPAQDPQPQPVPFWVFTRDRWLQWLLAVIGAVIGVVLARLFAVPLATWLVGHHNGWATFVAVLLWIASVCGLFAVGGFIGLGILTRRRQQH